MSLESDGVDRVHSLQKFPKRLHGTYLCINYTQTLRDAPKHEFRAQRGGSGAFVSKNYDATSWHELLQ